MPPHASPARKPFPFQHSWCGPQCKRHAYLFKKWERQDEENKRRERQEKLSAFLSTLTGPEREVATHCSLCLEKAYDENQKAH